MTLRLNVRTAAIVAAALTSALACSAPPASQASPDPSASAEETVFIGTPPPTPRTTPPGTPGAIPTAAIAASANIKTPQPDPNASTTPSPQPGLWRLEGYVVDEKGAPLPAVCVVLGPLGCQTWSPKTDDRGYWFIDIAQGHTLFDVFFMMPGHKTIWWRTIPEGPTKFNVILPQG
jgi:hypothetical protein